MNKLSLCLSTLLLISSLPALAKDYKFSYAGGRFVHTEQASSWSEAYEKAAHHCFNHFSGANGREKIRLQKSLATDIIDICANPRRG